MSTLVSLGRLAEELGVSGSWVRELTNRGLIPVTLTKGGHRRYDLDEARAAFERTRASDANAPTSRAGQIDQQRGAVVRPSSEAAESPTVLVDEIYTAADLDESRVWKQIAPILQLDSSAPSAEVARYAFTEMLNNAIDHASAKQIRVRVSNQRDRLRFEIIDDGVGVFAHLAEGLGLDDPREAVAELSKGKRTTDPSHHSGEGIFFTSKAVADFALQANGIAWLVDNDRADFAFGSSDFHSGTLVAFTINRNSSTKLSDVFARFTRNGRFVRSNPIIRLFEIDVAFVSRSEAKRLLDGMDSFDEITLDFSGVQFVGQGFVDEVFRVWQNAHPSIVLTPIGMNSEVEFMVKRGLARAEELKG
jgi:anti-sigma regulatory factor (Ser/Thr protein kinase)